MARPTAPYTTADLELLKRRLPGILSCTKQEVATMARQEYPHEVTNLADVFIDISAKWHRWGNFTLAQVPLDRWVPGPGDVEHLKPYGEASMRFLSKTPDLDRGPDDTDPLAVRRDLFEAFPKGMSNINKNLYGSMLQWIAVDAIDDPRATPFPINADTAFGHNLSYFEALMNEQVFIYEANWMAEYDWPQTETVPPEITRLGSEKALAYLSKAVQRWCDEDEKAAVPNSLLALTSANFSVNRLLLEFTAMEARGREAAQMNMDFLSELNRKGVHDVPLVMEGLHADVAAQTLSETLRAWFGKDGAMLGSGSLIRRPMTPSDIDMVVNWSQQLQENYILSRGGRGGPEQARAAHGSSNNLFIFAIAMVGAFYTKARTAYEFTGHSNPSYAVFPARNDVASGKRESPPAHAEHFLMQAYGQIFFANSGWELSADRIATYAETASIKRAHVQQLLRFAVKNRSSSELLVLHHRLERIRDYERKERESAA